MPRWLLHRECPLGSVGRNDSGFGLVELLIALTVLTIGIMGIVAGFSSAMVTSIRAARASTAGVIADVKMEGYRRTAFASIPVSASPLVETPTGPDGRTYWMQTDIVWQCPLDRTTSTSSIRPACPDVSGVSSRAVKLVTIAVRDGSSTARLLFSESSTFDEATGS